MQTPTPLQNPESQSWLCTYLRESEYGRQQIPDEILFNEKETHNVYTALARAHKMRSTKKKRPHCISPTSRSPRQRPTPPNNAKSSMGRSPLSIRSSGKSKTVGVASRPLMQCVSPRLPGKGGPGKNIWEQNGRALYDSITRDRNTSEFCVEPDSDIDWCNPDKHDETPLMKACDYGNADVVKQLINLGASINFKSSLGETALMHACSNGSDVCVSLLLTCGADIYAKDAKGWTAYSHALQSGCHQAVRTLQRESKGQEFSNDRLNQASYNPEDSSRNEDFSRTYPPTGRKLTRRKLAATKCAASSSKSYKHRPRTQIARGTPGIKPNIQKTKVRSAYGVNSGKPHKEKMMQETVQIQSHKAVVSSHNRKRLQGTSSSAEQKFEAWATHTDLKQQDSLNVLELQQLQFQLSRVAVKAEQAKATIQSALDQAYKTPVVRKSMMDSSEPTFQQHNEQVDILGRLHGLLEDVSLMDTIARAPTNTMPTDLDVEEFDDERSHKESAVIDFSEDNPKFAQTIEFSDEPSIASCTEMIISEERSAASSTTDTVDFRRDSLSQEQVVHYAAHFAETHDPHDHRLQGCLLYCTSLETNSRVERIWEKRYVRMDDNVKNLHMYADEAMQMRCDPMVDLTQVCGLAFEHQIDMFHDTTVDSDGKSLGSIRDGSCDLSTVFSVVINDDTQNQSSTRLFFSTFTVPIRNRGVSLSISSRSHTSSDSALLWIGRLGRMCQLAKDMKDRKLADLQKLERTAFEERQRAMIENVEKGVQARAVAWEIEREHAAWQADVSITAQVELSFLLQLAREKFNAVVNQTTSGIDAVDASGSSESAGDDTASNVGHKLDEPDTLDVQGVTEVAKFVLLGWRPNGKDIGSMRRHRLLSQLKEHVLGEMVAQAEHRAREHAEAEWLDVQVSPERNAAKINKEEAHNTVRFTFQQLAGCLIFLYYGYKEDNNLIAREDKVVARAPPGNKRGTLMRRGSVAPKPSSKAPVKPRSKSMLEIGRMKQTNSEISNQEETHAKPASYAEQSGSNGTNIHETQIAAVQRTFKAAQKWQSLWRARQARLQVVKEVQMRGTLLAMPGTIQGQSGWYERLNADGVRLVTHYHVDANDNWSRIEGPLEYAHWRAHCRSGSSHPNPSRVASKIV